MTQTSNACLALIVLVCAAASPPAFATGTFELARGASYQQVRTAHEQFLAGEPTLAQRREAMKQLVRASPYGERGLDRILHGFERAYDLDPRIPGVEKSARLLSSPSAAQRKGYMRELAYAQGFNKDPRFRLTAMNEGRVRSWGRTDADLVLRHTQTGLQIRVEVKDVSLASQSTNGAKLKRQIDGMAREAQASGEVQLWMNRRPITPELRSYAERRNVLAVGEVKTGVTTRGMAFAEASQLVHQSAMRIAYTRAAVGVTGVVFGAMLIHDNAPDLVALAQLAAAGKSLSAADWRLVGERSGGVLSGAGILVTGTTSAALPIAPVAMRSSLTTLTRGGGVLALVGFAISEGFVIAKYRAGDLSGQEFWIEQMALTGAVAGGTAGYLAGAATGTPLGPIGGVVGGTVGSAGGAWIGGVVGRKAATAYYDQRERKYASAYATGLYIAYGVVPPSY